MTASATPPVWRPYEDPAVLTANMTRGPAYVPEQEMAKLRSYLDALVSARSAPVHVNVAFNAAYFGFDLTQGGYLGGPLELDDFPILAHDTSCQPAPVGALVSVVTGSNHFFAEVVYREGAHPAVDDDRSVPAWLSGAPATADSAPRPGQPLDLRQGQVRRRERLVLDFAAFTAQLAPTAAQLDRLRRDAKHMDANGHVSVDACYPDGELADRGEALQYRDYLLTVARDLLRSAAAPLPLSTLLSDNASEDDLRAALAGLFATVASALAGLESVRLWGEYAFPRASFGRRLVDTGVFGGPDLGMLATQLASSAGGSRRSKWAPARSVTYTAIGPLLRQIQGAGRALHGTGYATLVAHANTVVGDSARGEADPDTGLLAGGVHLRVDDTWQAGGIWRAERPGVVQPGADVTDPLGLGWAEAAGLLTVHSPDPTPVAAPEPETEPEEEPEDEGKVLSVTDSQVMWTQTLRLAHQMGYYLPIPRKLGALWDGTLAPGPVKLSVHHEGQELEPDEASQDVTLSRAGDTWALDGVTWPLEFFAGIVLLGTWQRGGRMLRVQSTLLDAPVTVDGFDIAHRYDPSVLTREGMRADEQDQTWAARVLAMVRKMGLLDFQGCAVIAGEQLLSLVAGTGTPQDLDAARTAIDDLVNAGKLTAATGGAGPAGQLLVPCPAGAQPVAVVRYIPQVVVGAPRRPPAPAVLRGLISTSGVSPDMLREIEVAGHIRRLPWGQQASAQKRAEYRQFRAQYRLAGPAELPHACTFVSPFRREV